MILVADSGSTGTDWCVIRKDGKEDKFKTDGINPALHPEDKILKELNDNVKPQVTVAIEQIYYYGTGVATEELANLMAQMLKSVFPSAQSIETYSDLFGSARAICGTKAGIACILGTGSNSCLFDGTKITDNVPAGGYILGDEGSGSAMGRRLLNAYLKRGLPDDIREKLQQQYSLSMAEIIQQVYRNGHNSKYLASFTRFMNENIQNHAIARLVSLCLAEFLDNNVMKYADCKNYPVGFVGSIAHHFRPMLEEEAKKRGLTIGKIIQAPIDELAAFHKK